MDAASLYGCTGWVRNEWDGSVTILKDADVIDHSLSNIFGEGSPIGKLYELNGDDYSVLPCETPSVWPDGQPAPSEREPVRSRYAPKASLSEGDGPPSGPEGV